MFDLVDTCACVAEAYVVVRDPDGNPILLYDDNDHFEAAAEIGSFIHELAPNCYFSFAVDDLIVHVPFGRPLSLEDTPRDLLLQVERQAVRALSAAIIRAGYTVVSVDFPTKTCDRWDAIEVTEHPLLGLMTRNAGELTFSEDCEDWRLESDAVARFRRAQTEHRNSRLDQNESKHPRRPVARTLTAKHRRRKPPVCL